MGKLGTRAVIHQPCFVDLLLNPPALAPPLKGAKRACSRDCIVPMTALSWSSDVPTIAHDSHATLERLIVVLRSCPVRMRTSV